MESLNSNKTWVCFLKCRVFHNPVLNENLSCSSLSSRPGFSLPTRSTRPSVGTSELKVHPTTLLALTGVVLSPTPSGCGPFEWPLTGARNSSPCSQSGARLHVLLTDHIHAEEALLSQRASTWGQGDYMHYYISSGAGSQVILTLNCRTSVEHFGPEC